MVYSNTSQAAFSRLKSLLYNLFRFDTADLDFGFYRLLKLKETEIRNFIEEQLPAEVERIFQEVRPYSPEQLHKRLESARRDLLNGAGQEALLADNSLNVAFLEPFLKVPAIRGLVEVYKQAQADLSVLQVSEEKKAEVFNALYNFFARYYEDGDFIPHRYYGRFEAYAVPYNGEETAFYWTSRSQHYVKTGERLRDYTFRVGTLDGEVSVHFILRAAQLTRENLKGKYRFFFPQLDAIVYDPGDQTLTLPFEYRLPTAEELDRYGPNSKGQEAILQEAVPLILAKTPDLLLFPLSQETDDAHISLLLRHLHQFVRRQTGDYFVHTDLKHFLTRELDFYLKDQLLTISDVIAGDVTEKSHILKVVRHIASTLIEFLTQLANVEKRLFEKRKFVLQTDYLVPIQRISRDLWPDILANQAQVRAWQAMFDLQGTVNEAVLEAHPTLVVHTRHFDEDFKLQLLSQFGDLDEATDGILINAENYQALRFLEPRFSGQVRMIYIDPPYNTGSDQFIYKDRYQHATWLTMMEERLQLARALLAEDGVIFVSIDDNEQYRLRVLMDLVFGPENFIATIIWQKVFAPKNTARYFSEDHDFILVYARDALKWQPGLLPRSEEALQRYANPDNDERGVWSSSDLTARNYYSEGQYEVKSPKGQVFRPTIGTYWRVSYQKFLDLDKDKRIWWGPEGNSMPRFKRFLSEVKPGVTPQTLWLYKDVGHTQDAKRELVAVVDFERNEDVLNTVKPTALIQRMLHLATQGGDRDIVLDFFAGSGTTGHAVINLNREDDGARRFMLVEMGTHFDDILMPRILRTMYCPTWKDRKPKDYPQPHLMEWPDWVERTPRLVQVVRLEYYEDSLHNLVTPATLAREEKRANAYKEVMGQQTYLLHYLVRLPLESSASMLTTDTLAHPFDYTLEILTDEGPVAQRVDLVETFNALYGLQVERMERWINSEDGREYRAVIGRKQGKRVLILWRDMENLNVEQERAFLEPHIKDFDEVLINGNTAVPGIGSLDSIFKQQMEEMA